MLTAALVLTFGCGERPLAAVDAADAEWAAPGSSPDTDTAERSGWPSTERGPAAADPIAGAPGSLTVYAVRHAEKESEGDDPGLTEAGQARALALAERLHGVPLDAVYATELRRTQDTVRPTAEAHGLPIVTDIDAEQELAPHLLAAHRGDLVLHAGHSYTLPDFFRGLGFDDPPDVDSYGQLWIVTVVPGAEPTLIESTFGEIDAE